MRRRSTHLRDEQARGLSEIMQESRESDRFETLDSESETFRRLLDYALEHADLADLMSEDVRVKLARKRFVEDEATVRDWRAGFETRVKREFKKRWENGYAPEKLETYAENFHREVEILWPEWSAEDYADRRAEAHAYTEAVKEKAIETAETSEFDPLDPDEIFSHYRGVEDARESEQVEQTRDSEAFDRLVSEAVDRIESSVTSRSDDDLARALSNQFGTDESVTQEAVGVARERTTAGGVTADD